MNILLNLTTTDFKLKYNRNILGFFWSLIKPLLLLATLYIVFHVLMNIQVAHYELFLLLGIILWNFFVEATNYSMSAMTRGQNLIKKTKFDKKLLVLSSNASATITLILNLIVFFIFMAFAGVGLSWTMILFPIALVELIILTLGISFVLSTLYVRFRDLQHIWEVLTQIGFWITPIIYPVSIIPEGFLKYYILNPMARIIEDSRQALILQIMPNISLGYAKHVWITLIICFGILTIGLWLFERKSGRFAEEV